MRINKYLAEAGVCSRRGADELVSAGRVQVNGQAVGMGAQVEDGDDVRLDGRPVSVRTRSACHILLHKPVGVVSTASDPEGRPTVLDILPATFRTADGVPRRLYPAGRLDFFSEGLLLVTDDGALTHALTHPGSHVPRIYEVTVRETVTPAVLDTMRRGMTLAEGERLAPVGVRILSRPEPAGRTVLEMTLQQGVNRQIRRMCRDLQLTVLRLVRVALGPLRLGDLPSGEARLLTSAELAALQQALAFPRKKAFPHDSRGASEKPQAFRASAGTAPGRSTRKV